MTSRWQSIATATGLASSDGTLRQSIFSEMTALARQHAAANLGQGFPDSDGPGWIREIAVQAMNDGANQYPPARGIAELRAAIAAHQERHYGITLDPETEVMVTAGATEAIAATVLALVQSGDEVVTIEPFYDAHAATIAMAGATHVTVPLVPSATGFSLDLAALEAAVTERTRAILINTPHNPTGTVLTKTELDAIARAAQRADAIVITDEVYEHLTFDNNVHTPMATLPGMRDRTITISSSGKTFSYTGWKIGWLSGPAELVDAIEVVKQFLSFCGGAPFQPAIARALVDGDADIRELRTALARRKDLLIGGLRAAGFDVTAPGGTYFVCADATPFLSDEVPDGMAFARSLPERIGVACVPLAAFCREGSATAKHLANWVRFTFVKDEATIRRAITQLKSLAGAQ